MEGTVTGKIKTDADVYLCPKEASRKLKAALEFGKAAYLSGVTGIGKTSLVRFVLGRRKYEYYLAEETEPEQIPVQAAANAGGRTRKPGKDGAGGPEALEKNKPDTRKRIVVIDDLHTVSRQEYQERYAARIQELLKQEQVRLVLISRSPIPGWLLPVHVEHSFLEIPEKDFYFSREGQAAYLEQCGIWLEEKKARRVWELGGGHPVALKLLVLEKGDIDLAVKSMWLWLENHVYEQWEADLQEFLMETSIVENFTKELAVMITGRDNVEELLSRAEETGSFMTRKGEDGIWEYRWGMRCSMEKRLKKKYGREQIRRLYSHAGLYYEIQGRFREALEMYEICGDEESFSRVLIANARRNPASGQYFELRRYYLSLKDETIRGNPALISYMSMLQSILMDAEESERWYQELSEYAKSRTGGEKREAEEWLLYLDIALPHRGSDGLIGIFKNAGCLLSRRKTALPEFSVTTNLPSLMNGGKDFCEWSKKDRELARTIGKAVELVLGKYGKGLVSLALAESSLEKGVDSYRIMELAEKGRMSAESGGKVELCFVAAALMAWLAILNGNVGYAEETMMVFRNRAEQEAPRLLPNIDAFLCRIFLYQKRPADVREWLKSAPEEREAFCTLERFRYLTKARAYLQAGAYEAAAGLLEQLLYYAEKMKRPYIAMEASLLSAVVQYRMEREGWKETLVRCTTQAESYGFVRIFSREGEAVLPLLETGGNLWKDEAFGRQVLEECKRMGEFYPGYLEPGIDSRITLPENAIRILRLQAEGVSIKEIARRLNIQPDTVKYHSRETYRKLGVNSRTAAVNEARKRNLI